MELPHADEGRPRERADAARNRQRVLEAAGELFAERGVQAVTMSEVARAAGVAKGTVFQRFGDRAGLAQALVDAAERELQGPARGGAAAAGPGVSSLPPRARAPRARAPPPRERLAAFLDALLTLTAEHRDLLLEIDSAGPSARHRTGAYRGWLQHVAYLLEEAGVKADRDLLAHVLLAPLSPDLLWHLEEDQGGAADDLRRVVTSVLPAAIAPPPPTGGR